MHFRLPAALAAAGLTATLAATAAVPSAARADELPLKDQLFTAARASVVEMATKSSATDLQYLQDGRFRYNGPDCPRCELGPAVTAAALARRTGDPEMLGYATTVFDAALRDQVKANGGFSNGLPNEGGNLIQTVLFAEHLGAATLYLGDTLDPARKAAYTTAVTRAVDYLKAQGMHTWYTNGNINLALTVATGEAWKLSGNAKYQTMYEQSLQFTLAPDQARWPGFGLQKTAAGNNGTGVNALLAASPSAAAYLAEKGSAAPGFDADYVTFQADIASQGYQTVGDPRLLALANQLDNQLLSRTNTTTWQLDISKGSRHPSAVGTTTLITPAGYVVAASRPEMRVLAESELRNSLPTLRGWGTNSWSGGYQSMGTVFAVDVMAAP